MSARVRTRRKADDDDEDAAKPESKISCDKNHIYFYSEIDRNTVYDLIGHIRTAEEFCVVNALRMSLDEIPIYLHINSYGGCIHSALAAIDVIQNCRVPVHSIIEGATASAGTLISVSCDKRYISKNAYMLIHQLSSSYWGKMTELEDEFKNLTELMKHLKQIYVENTNIPKKKLAELLKHDLWLNSDTSLEYGLADELWLK